MVGRRLTIVQLLPALESGGVERGTLEMARALVQAGHRSIVISTGGRMVAQLTAEGSEHVTWGISKRSHLFALRFVRKLRELCRRERVDLIHARSRHPAWVAWLAWRGMPVDVRPRFLTTAHGLYSVNAYSAVMARGERVIAISNTVRDYLLRSYPRLVRPESIEVIYRGIDPREYHPEFRPSPEWRARWNEQYPQLRDCPLLTLPGRLTRLKGHSDFLRMLELVRRDVPEVRGLIVGGTDPRRRGYERELQAEVDARGLRDVVAFTGQRDDLREILAISTVAYSLSAKPPEAFGRTVVEALSLGTPVIGYDHAGAGEILQRLHPQGGVPPGDVAAAARSTVGLLRGEPRTIHPNTVFTAQSMIDRTLALYLRVTG